MGNDADVDEILRLVQDKVELMSNLLASIEGVEKKIYDMANTKIKECLRTKSSLELNYKKTKQEMEDLLFSLTPDNKDRMYEIAQRMTQCAELKK